MPEGTHIASARYLTPAGEVSVTRWGRRRTRPRQHRADDAGVAGERPRTPGSCGATSCGVGRGAGDGPGNPDDTEEQIAELGLPASKVWRLKWEPGDWLGGSGSGPAARESTRDGR